MDLPRSFAKRLHPRSFVAALGFVFVVGYAKHTRAGDDAIFVEYDASEGCPDARAFMEEIHARTPRARFVSEPKGTRVFSVSVRRQEHETIGRLSTRRSGENGAPREVAGKTCAEVVSALALVAALAIDPHASTALVATAPIAATARTNAPPSEAPKPAPTVASETPAPPSLPPSAALADVGPSRRDASPRAGSLRGGLRGVASTWPTSEPVVFGAVLGSIAYAWSAPSFWSPSVRLSGSWGESLTVRPASGAARFARKAGALDVCPGRWAASRVVLRPCAGFEVGALAATGLADGPITHTGEANVVWVAVRETMQVEVGLGNGWSIDVEGGISTPLRRDEFVFHTPDVQISRVPAVEPLVALGVGAHFW
jgi:hypothetical protein